MKWNLTPNMTKKELKVSILSLFEECEMLEKLEIEVKLSNGTKIELEFEADEEDDDEEENYEEGDDENHEENENKEYS